MFTGIIEEVGEIQTINQANESLELDESIDRDKGFEIG